MLAAHAARQLDIPFQIVSLGAKSKLYGAQYLHAPIPGIPRIPHTTIEHIFKGTINGYRGKVYGMEWEGVVSPERYAGTSYAWDIRYAYDWLWDEYSDQILVHPIRYADTDIDDALLNHSGHVISTIPRRVLCVDPDHEFKSAEIYCVGDAPDLGIVSPIKCVDNKLICSGDPQDSWYRVSRIFGQSTCEWARKGQKPPPIEGITKVLKPTTTNCDCHPEFTYLGRYGQWKKGVLVHDVYKNAVLMLRDKLLEAA